SRRAQAGLRECRAQDAESVPAARPTDGATAPAAARHSWAGFRPWMAAAKAVVWSRAEFTAREKQRSFCAGPPQAKAARAGGANRIEGNTEHPSIWEQQSCEPQSPLPRGGRGRGMRLTCSAAAS